MARGDTPNVLVAQVGAQLATRGASFHVRHRENEPTVGARPTPQRLRAARARTSS